MTRAFIIGLGFLATGFFTSLVHADDVPSPAGLVAWWRGEGNALDSIGTNNGVEIGDVQYVPGKVGMGFSLNGTNSYIRIPYSPNLSFSNALTIELWYKSVGTGWGGGLVNARNDESGPINYGLFVAPDDVITAYLNDPAVVDADHPGDFENSDYFPAPASGSFHHLAATFQQVTNDVLVVLTYLDGQLVKTRTFNADLARAVGTAPVTIGVDAEYPSYDYFNGVVDEISIYNRALASNEIAAIYNADSAGKTAPTNTSLSSVGLVGRWKGDGNGVDSVAGNNGTLVNCGFTNGVMGQAFSFDPENFPWGTYSGVQIADQPAYALTNALTIEGWVRPRGDGYIIFFRGDHRPGLDPYCLSMQANNTIRFEITDTDSNSASVETTLNYFEWTHVAATLDGDAGTLSLFTNGVLAAQTTTSVRPFGDMLPDQSPGIGIGNLNDGGNNFPFLGDLDEISLYSRALSVSEIAADYNSSSVGKGTPTNNLASGLAAWWRGEGDASDAVGTNNGVQVGNVVYDAGQVGQAFVLDHSTSYITVPASPSLDIGTGSGITIECWTKPDAYTATVYGGPIIEWDSATTDGLQLWSGDTLFANVKDTSGINHTLQVSTGFGTNQFYHIALTYDKNSGLAILYLNGTNVASANFGNITPQTTYPLNIGRRTGQPVGLNDTYGGAIDELSLYSRALTANEIAAIYNASKGVPPVVNPLVVPATLSFTPAAATNGAILTLSGTNFSPTAAENIVYFGAVRATVLEATPTSLQVTVPVGATFAPITVTTGGLTTYSLRPFLPTFAGTGAPLSADSFGPRQNLESGNGPIQVVIADLDNDGKPDLIVANDYNNTISLYRNISTNHTLTAASFAAPVDLATPTGSYSPYGIAAADVDGDGKLDIIATDFIDQNVVSVYRNTCTPGDISSNSFATRVDFPTGSQPQGVAVADIDGDGRPDLLVANIGDGTVSILRNTSVVGSLTADSFAPKVDFATGGGCANVTVGDLDGDGIPDVVTANSSGFISVLRNLSSPGNIAFQTKVDFTTPEHPDHVKLVDLDGDGNLDVVVECYISQTMSVFRNVSTAGSLTADSLTPRIDFPLGGRGHTTAVGDLDGDGKPDLAVATELDSLISIFQNASTPGGFNNSSLTNPANLSTGWNAWGVTVGDLDGDGRPDVVFANSYDHNISIYQNQAPFAARPPFITTQPAGQIVGAGGQVNFSVTVVGTAPFAYQWKRNGSIITGATNATLTLTNLHVSQSGNYSVTITNAFGSIASSNAVLTASASDILAYTYSGTDKVITLGQELSYNYSGRMFFVPSGTNGVFIGWATLNGKKQYWVSPFSDYRWITIPGNANHVYTVLGKAGNGLDDSGHPHLWSYLHRGLNAQLAIGNKKKFSFPAIFTCNDTHVYPDAQTGKMILRVATSTYLFASPATQSANNSGQTLADLVNALTKSLAKQGYQKQ